MLFGSQLLPRSSILCEHHHQISPAAAIARFNILLLQYIIPQQVTFLSLPHDTASFSLWSSVMTCSTWSAWLLSVCLTRPDTTSNTLIVRFVWAARMKRVSPEYATDMMQPVPGSYMGGR